MKVYLVKLKDAADLPCNMCAWADYEGEANEFVASIHVMSVKAFLKRKYVAEYIAKLPENVRPYREIVPFSSPERARTRPKRAAVVSTRRSYPNAQNARKREEQPVQGLRRVLHDKHVESRTKQ